MMTSICRFEMISFLQSYLDFANNINVNPYDMSERYGLCDNLDKFYVNKKLRRTNVRYLDMSKNLQEALKKVNSADVLFPFGEADYDIRQEAWTQHECPKRLAFVKQYLAELKNDCTN